MNQTILFCAYAMFDIFVSFSCRADYWVSQTRKYCDFCKCWITDNRPSVDFHEKGRRHQENVKKKLRNITKHSAQTQRNTEKIDITLRQMESAALEAYQKDIESRGDLSSMIMKQKQLEGGRVTKLWNEEKTRDGKTCYVNVVTKETIWKAPAEGYLTLQEQRDHAESEAQQQLKALEKQKRKEGIIMMHKIREEEAEAAARKAREKLKERRVVDDLPLATCGPLLEPGKTNPYGRWQTVQERPFVDYQLPVQEAYEEVAVQYEPEPVMKEFKEKTVTSLDAEEAGCSGFTFKKRKLVSGAKRNTRQRLDDD